MTRRERRAAQKRENSVQNKRIHHQIVALVQEGIALHQQGQLDNAASIYNQILQLDAKNGDALHMLGVVQLQYGNHEQAVELITQAIANGLETALALNNLGVALRSLGRHAEAATHYRHAVTIQPDYIEARINLGNALRDAGKISGAIQSYRETLNQMPDSAEAHSGLALALTEKGWKDEASPHHRRAAELDPQSAIFQNNLGYLLYEEKDLEGALNAFQNALALDDQYAPAHFGIATALQLVGRGLEGEQAARSGLTINELDATGWNALGLALRVQGKFQEAAEAFRQSLSLEPDSPDAASNLGSILEKQGNFEDAITEAYNNRSLVYLASGLFAEGWRDYRMRQSVRELDMSLEQNSLPDRLDGKHILLKFDQGLGDEIFFLRFLDRLRERNPEITYQTQEKIADIVRRYMPDDEVITNTQQVNPAEYDLCISIGDLPHLLDMQHETDIPSSISLSVLPENLSSIKKTLKELGPPPYFGLTWRAGTEHYNRLFKNVPKDAMANALRGVKGTYVSLQRNPQYGETKQLQELIGEPVYDLTSLNDDLETMLALLFVLDDYICVSNTNVHLRAGVGKPSRVLVPFPAEYRWMHRGEKSPWFPETSLYRQAANLSWDKAMETLSSDFRMSW